MTLNPFDLRNDTVRITGIKQKHIQSSDKTSFTIEIQNKSKCSRLTKLDIVEGISCVTGPHKYYNKCKGMVYVQENDITDIPQFDNGRKTNMIQ